jgi:hypothetical protein
LLCGPSPHPVSWCILTEARAALADKSIIKSEAGQLTLRILVRALECLVHGQPVTQHPPKHHGADDGLGL